MRAIDVEFLRLGATSLRRYWIAAALLLILATVFALVATSFRQQIGRHPPTINDQRAAVAAPVIEAAEYAVDAAQLAKAARADLAGVFASLESAQVQGLRVSTLEVNTAERQVRIELELRQTSDLLRYLDAINAGEPADSRWTLVHAQGTGHDLPGSATLTRRLAFSSR